MIYENSTRLFPDDCKYKDVLGYANLATDWSIISNLTFETDNSMKGTKCYIALTAELDANESGYVIIEVDSADGSKIYTNTTVKAKDLKGSKEVKVPLYTDCDEKSFILKVSGSISKGGLFATLKYEVG